MKKIMLSLLLLPLTIHPGNPNREINKEAVHDLISTVASGELITEEYEQKLFNKITIFDCNVPFHYKAVEYECSPLFAAVVIGNERLLRTIIRYGASVDFANPEQVTPLMQAAFQNKVSLMKILLEHGADKDKKNWEGKKAYDYAQEGVTLTNCSALSFFAEIIAEERRMLDRPEESFIGQNPLFNPEFVTLPETLDLL